MNRLILQKKLRKILIEENPVRIYFPEDKNVNEYDGEIKTIIKILPTIKSKQQLSDLIYQIFKASFGNIYATKSDERYRILGARIWEEIIEDKSN